MHYTALITIDLPGATDRERDKFYEILKKERWVKLDNLTTAWQMAWSDDINRDATIKVLKTDIGNAIFLSGVTKVNYAIQVGKGDIEVGQEGNQDI